MATTFFSTMLTTDLTTLETTEETSTVVDSTSPATTTIPDETTFITTDATTVETTFQSSTIEHISTEFPLETTFQSSTTIEYTSTEFPSETTFQSSTIEYISTEFPLETTPIPDLTTIESKQTTLTEKTTELLSSPPAAPFDMTTTQFTTILTSTSTSTTTTTFLLSPKPKIPRRKTTSSSTSTIRTTITTTTTTKSTTMMTSRRSRLELFNSDQQMAVIRPKLNSNSSNTLLSNDLLKSLFNNTANSSQDKLIIVDLGDLPPSTWDVSFSTNESILLDITLPPSSSSMNSNTTTNLSITNVEANRFSTNIIGLPLNLQLDQVQAKQVSLAMNLSQEQSNQTISDVIIGRVRSEQFELNITKSDNMNLQVQQVDSETAELFFDDKFCTNESNLQINLNLSKNGI